MQKKFKDIKIAKIKMKNYKMPKNIDGGIKKVNIPEPKMVYKSNVKVKIK
jgi:MOSC domain-containing protein YiiM